MKRLVLFSLCCLTASSGFAHPSHNQITEVEWNAKTGRFEVAMRLEAAALEDVLSVRMQKRVSLESLDRQQTLRDALTRYLSAEFQIREQGISAPSVVRWAGAELELHSIWLYFEMIPTGHSRKPFTTTRLEVRHRVLSDVRSESAHLVRLLTETGTRTVHTSAQEWIPFAPEPPLRSVDGKNGLPFRP